MTEIIASLVFDSRTDAIPGLRSSNGASGRHLIYEGGGLILDLSLTTNDEGSCMHIGGQILPADSAPETVSEMPVTIQQGKERRLTRTNALGEFVFHSVSNGTLDLSITLLHHTFTVRGLSNDEPRMWRVVATTIEK
jgi:hypothetical protein